MRGSPVYQVQCVYNEVKEIGQSKHEAKELARVEGAKTFSEIAKQTGIYSYSTADSYRDVWRNVMEHAKENFGVKDIERLNVEIVQSYLNSRIADGVAHSTFALEAAAAGKLETALNRYADNHGTGREYDFTAGINEARGAAKDLEKFDGSRAYADPDRLVSNVRGENFSLAADMQRESGARISEVNHISEKHLAGLKPDHLTGETKGHIEVQGKGGKERELMVSPETYQRISQAVAGGKTFKFDGNEYRVELKEAAERSGQNYEGSHGLRWSWAQERHAELQEKGMNYEQSLSEVSKEMGHERADITEHYLR